MVEAVLKKWVVGIPRGSGHVVLPSFSQDPLQFSKPALTLDDNFPPFLSSP